MKIELQKSGAIHRRRLSRRRFIQASTAAAAFSAASWSRVFGANERVGVGVIGFGLIGRIHTRNFKAQPDVQIVGIAETYRPRLDAAVELIGGSVAKYGELRLLLGNKTGDGVGCGTPHPCHALVVIIA